MMFRIVASYVELAHALVEGRADEDLELSLEAWGRFASQDRAGWGAARLLRCLDAVVEIGQRAESLAAALTGESQLKGAALKAEGLDVESHLRLTHKLTGSQARRLARQGEALKPFGVIGQ
ncbi:MAG: hypothetical protein LBU05_05490, partial [Bifidobacteriaceae bacterium]|nr:hypothetical protein [Bifidobacteriaceae bacterium]